MATKNRAISTVQSADQNITNTKGPLWFKPLEVKSQNIPQELKISLQWVCWRLEPNKDPKKKPRKVPKQAFNGRNASSINPNTWCDYNTALNAYNDRKGKRNAYSGVGFVLTADDDIVGIDLDGIIGELDGVRTGTDNLDIRRLMKAVNNSGCYWEVSPSGTGIRIMVRGILKNARTNKTNGVEVYNTGRFLTITGNGRGELIKNQEIVSLACKAAEREKNRALEVDELPNTGKKVDNAKLMLGVGSQLFVFDLDHFKLAAESWDGSRYDQKYLDKPQNTDVASEGVFMDYTRTIVANWEAAPEEHKDEVKQIWANQCHDAMKRACKEDEYSPEGNEERWNRCLKDFHAAQAKRDAGEETRGITATRLYWAVDMTPRTARIPEATLLSLSVPEPKVIWNLSLDEKRLFPDIYVEKDADSGAITKVVVQATENNIKHVLNHMGLLFAHNVITKKIVSNVVPGGMTKRQEAISIYDKVHSRVYSMLSKNSIKVSNLEGFLKAASGEITFNPVILYLDQLKWDGIPRFDQLAAALNASDPAMALLFVRIFMMQAVALADGCERSPHPDKVVKGEYVPLMHGGQGTKKSTLFPSLVPTQLQQYVGSVPDLDPDNADSLLRALGYWIVEVGEIDTQFKRKETERYKAFLSMSTDEIRKPYGREAITMTRRTMFCATVNRQEALNDATGNRRYIPISVGTIDHKAIQQIDIDQLWAEAMSRYLGGEQWWPTDAEQALSDDAVREFQTSDMIEDAIREKWDFNLLRNKHQPTEQLSATVIYETLFPGESAGLWRGTRQITNVMPKVYPLGWHTHRMCKNLRGVKKWLVPKT